MRNIGLQSDVAAMRQEIAQQKAYAATRDKFVALMLTAAEKQIISDIARIDQELEAPIQEAIAGAIEQAMAFDSGTVSQIFAQQINPLNQKALQEINQLVEIQAKASHAFLESSIAGDRELVLFLSMLGGLGVASAAKEIKALIDDSVQKVDAGNQLSAQLLTIFGALRGQGCHFLDSRYYQRQANHNQHQTRDATHCLIAQWWRIFFAGHCSQGNDR